MPDQLAFEFSDDSEPPPQGDGLHAWRNERRRQIEALARKQGLPIGHRVRVDFENGPPLEGLLVLNEELLFAPTGKQPDLHLRIGNADFHADEIAGCTRIESRTLRQDRRVCDFRRAVIAFRHPSCPVSAHTSPPPTNRRAPPPLPHSSRRSKTPLPTTLSSTPSPAQRVPAPSRF